MTKRTACTVGGDGQTTTRRRRIAKVTPQPKPKEQKPSRVQAPLLTDLPKATQARTVLGRLQIALDVPFQRVAEILGVTPGELLELQAIPDTTLGGLDVVFEQALAHVNTRLGMLIATRSELEERLYKSRQAAMARRQRIRGTE